MYILVDENNVIVAASNSTITSTANGYIADGVLYLDKHLTSTQSSSVTSDSVQTKCFCRNKDNCFGSDCIHYNECYVGGQLKAVYNNPAYGEVSVDEGKTLIVNELKAIRPDLDVSSTDIFPEIADSIDVMLDDANAVTTEILSGKTAYVDGAKITGSVSTYSGSTTITPSSSAQTINTNQKYLSTDLTVTAVTSSIDPDIVATNIRRGKDILGVTGTNRVVDTYNSLLDVDIDNLAENDIIEVTNPTYIVEYQLTGSEYGSINKRSGSNDNCLPNTSISLVATVGGEVGDYFAGWYKNSFTAGNLLSSNLNYTYVSTTEDITIIAVFSNHAND